MSPASRAGVAERTSFFEAQPLGSPYVRDPLKPVAQATGTPQGAAEVEALSAAPPSL